MKIKSVVLYRALSGKWKDNLQNERKYLHIIYLIRVYYPHYIDHSYNSAMKWQLSWKLNKVSEYLKKDISSKKIRKLVKSTWKDVNIISHREMQTKPLHMRYHSTPSCMAIIKETGVDKYWLAYGKIVSTKLLVHCQY